MRGITIEWLAKELAHHRQRFGFRAFIDLRVDGDNKWWATAKAADAHESDRLMVVVRPEQLNRLTASSPDVARRWARYLMEREASFDSLGLA